MDMINEAMLKRFYARDRATFERRVQTSVGIVHVIVNGVPVVRDSQVTGARPGRPLRRGGG